MKYYNEINPTKKLSNNNEKVELLDEIKSISKTFKWKDKLLAL